MGYQYRVVSSCGSGVYTLPVSYQKALKRLAVWMVDHSDTDDFELERVAEVRGTLGQGVWGHAYWLWRDGGWRRFGHDDRVHNPTEQDFAYWRRRVERAMGWPDGALDVANGRRSDGHP
jgi:hypothetical protein